MTSCCKIYGECRQSDTCPHRTGVVLPHQADHACRVAKVKSTRPAWLPGDVVPPETGNFKIIDLGPDEVIAPVRSLMAWLLVVLAVALLAVLLVSYSTEAHAAALWSLLQGVA